MMVVQTLLSAWFVLIFLMTLCWIIQQKTGKAAIVDVMWCFGVLAASLICISQAQNGIPMRQGLAGMLISVWSLRLGVHLARRTLLNSEDGRYQTLKKQWGKAAQRKMFWFFQFQALTCVLFAIPLLIASNHSRPLGVFDGIGLMIGAIAITGEWVADFQLTRFRAQPKRDADVCTQGLWYYSRHPNYFFEWLHWWTYVFLSIGSPLAPLSLVGPLAIFYFLFCITGIPPTEAQSLQKRGVAYQTYRETTSAFFPWPPRHKS